MDSAFRSALQKLASVPNAGYIHSKHYQRRLDQVEAAMGGLDV